MAYYNPVIRNHDRIKQTISFEDMECGITDIDGTIEYHNKAWFIFEAKYNGKEFNKDDTGKTQDGQKILMERFVQDTCRSGEKFSIAVVVDHTESDFTKPIMLKDCKVREFKVNFGRWRAPTREITAKELVHYIEDKIDQGKLKWLINAFKKPVKGGYKHEKLQLSAAGQQTVKEDAEGVQ